MTDRLPLQIQKAVRRYRPIQAAGLTLYPIKVKDLDQFQLAKPALEALQQSFPVRLMSMPILQAFYRLDHEAAVEGRELTGLFSSALLGLALALRIGEGLDLGERLRQFTIVPEPDDHSRLKFVAALLNGEEMVKITPAQYGKLRKLIAVQNGVEIYGDDANPELVEAERIMRSQGQQLRGSVEDEIRFVSLLGYDEDAIDDWAILKLHDKANAMRRVLDYVVCAINEGAGCTWKGGNPAPHPWMEKPEQGTIALTELSAFAKGAAANAALQEQAPTF